MVGLVAVCRCPSTLRLGTATDLSRLVDTATEGMGLVAGTDHLDHGVHRCTGTRGACRLTPTREPLRLVVARLGSERGSLLGAGWGLGVTLLPFLFAAVPHGA